MQGMCGPVAVQILTDYLAMPERHPYNEPFDGSAI